MGYYSGVVRGHPMVITDTPVSFYYITWSLPADVDVTDYYTDDVDVIVDDDMCYYTTRWYFNYYTYNKDYYIIQDLCGLRYFTQKFRDDIDKLDVGLIETSCV